MLLKVILYGARWWIVNMAANGEVNAQTYGVSLWKFIRAGWDSFVNHISFVVGDGTRIMFWHDS